jgi:hypothetical protein
MKVCTTLSLITFIRQKLMGKTLRAQVGALRCTRITFPYRVVAAATLPDNVK